MCCVIGCTTDSTDEGNIDSIFPTPPIISEDKKETTPEPESIVEEPEPVLPHDGARDLVAPKLLKSSIPFGAIDVDVD